MKTIKETINLPTSKLIIGSFDLRTFSELDDLKTSIKNDGIMQPISVRPSKATPNKFDVIDGNRRTKIAIELKIKEVPAVIYSDLEDKDAWKMAIITNTIRETLSPKDQGEAIKRYMELYPDKSKETVAIELGINYHSLNQYLLLVELAPSIKLAKAGQTERTRKHEGLLGIDVATRLARITTSKIENIEERHAKQQEIAEVIAPLPYTIQRETINIITEKPTDTPIREIVKEAQENRLAVCSVALTPNLAKAINHFKQDRGLDTSKALKQLLLEGLRHFKYIV